MYSNLTFELGEMIADNDIVVASWKATGIANHDFFHDREGEISKKSLDAEGISVSTFADGKIVEHRLYWPRYPLTP
jgi:hypothetical protein